MQSLTENFNKYNISFCDSTCEPSLLYDAFLFQNVLSTQYNDLAIGLANAWLIQNNQLFNLNQVTVNVVTIDPNWETLSG